MLKLIILFVYLLISFTAAAQNTDTGGQGRLSALDNYRRGRNFESQNRVNEANTYYNEAIRVCQEEISRNSANRETYAVITWAFYRQKKYAEVISWGERGLRLYADEYRVIETMGEAYFYLGDHSRSLAFMQRYTNALPQGGERSSVAFFFIGEIYRLSGKNYRADIAYTTAVRLEPGVALWWYRLASVREALGDKNDAAEAYQRALLLNPNYQEARDGLARAGR